MRHRTVLLGIGIFAWLWTAAPAAGQTLTKSDRQGPVSVTVSLPGVPVAGRPVEVKVVLDTHSVGLDGVALDRVVTLRDPDGAEAAPTEVRTGGAGHHREARLTFAPVTRPGSIEVVVRDVGGIAERRFGWDVR
jgi:hypothetical protein